MGSLTSFLIKLATFGNLSLILWIVLELLQIPLYFIPTEGGPATFVTYLFSFILLGVVANIFSAIMVAIALWKNQPVKDLKLAKFNTLFLLALLVYYTLVS